MGRKAKFKELRRLASVLPVLPVKQVIGRSISGSDALKDRLLDDSGQAIDPDKRYYQKTVKAIAVNHHKKMKDAYNKNGGPGVAHYLRQVSNFVAAHNKPVANADH